MVIATVLLRPEGGKVKGKRWLPSGLRALEVASAYRGRDVGARALDLDRRSERHVGIGSRNGDVIYDSPVAYGRVAFGPTILCTESIRGTFVFRFVLAGGKTVGPTA
ncbi:hypothetical protein NL676_024427 [Syzygium grande]|nr:hypothetical protein NL676_024427 [Syzygium grande]